jgi:hypothetical protein
MRGMDSCEEARMSDTPWRIRPYDRGLDDEFIYKNILEAICRSPAGRRLGWSVALSKEKEEAWAEHRRLVAELLGDEQTVCDVACDSRHDGVMAAFAIHGKEEPVVHWFGVKHGMWPFAAELARDLLGHVFKDGGVRATLLIPDLKRLCESEVLPWRIAPDPTWLWRNFGL